MRFEWKDDIDCWQAVVQPGDAHEPGAGPVGPAGVSLVRIGAASFSLCTMTGRVVAGWVPGEPEERERALCELVLGPAADPSHFLPQGGPSFDHHVLPVDEREFLNRWAASKETVEHVHFGDDDVARLLARVEYATAAAKLRASGAAGAAVVPETDVTSALRAVDEVVERIRGAAVTVATLAAQLEQRGATDSAVDSLRQAVDTLPPGSSEQFVVDLLEELRRRAVAGSPGAVLEATDLPAAEPGVAPDATPGLPMDVRAGETLAQTAVALLGLHGEVTVTVSGRCHDVRIARTPGPDRFDYRWVFALADGHIVGGGQMRSVEDVATLRIIVADGVAVTSYRLEHNPLGRPNPGLRWRSYGAADTASRAGYACNVSGRRRSGSSRVDTMIFAAAAVAWLHLGQQFRAGWAWSLADKDEVARQLDVLGWRQWEPVLTAVAGFPDVPRTLLPPGAWARAVSPNRLLPRIEPEPPDDTALLTEDHEPSASTDIGTV